MAENKTPETKVVEKKGLAAVEVWPTKDEAEKVAQSRDKGARFAFEIKHNGKSKFCTAGHHHFASMLACKDAGIEVTEIGKAPRAPRSSALNAEGILAALNGMPEAERKAIMEQLAKLNAPAKTGVPPPAPAAKK